jgi:hypothetical protein
MASIETAPKDGTEVLIWARWDWDGMNGEDCSQEYSWAVASWEDYNRGGRWVSVSANPYSDVAVNPTDWEPLPPAPTRDLEGVG